MNIYFNNKIAEATKMRQLGLSSLIPLATWLSCKDPWFSVPASRQVWPYQWFKLLIKA
jgi:hypothetical protein